jgi:hypothetical protein
MLFDQKAVEHFLTLARRGKYPHASSGEERSARILQVITEHAAGLDSRAVEGAGHFMRLAAADYAAAMLLVEGKAKAS